jgi:alpha-1,6-mannosyltransferase
VRRYLNSKRAWLAANRPQVRTPWWCRVRATPMTATAGFDLRRAAAVRRRLSLAGGQERLDGAADPPAARHHRGRRSLYARPGGPEGRGRLGVPVVGFCHTDLGALAALHIGEWAEKPVQKRWAAIYRQFDQAVAPSRFIAGD